MAGIKNLGRVKVNIFENYLILSLSKQWISLNENKPLEFDIELTKEGKLILSSTLAGLNKTREVVTNAR